MQYRLRNYQNDLLSFEHNIMNLGLHTPGRYAGFDTFSIVDTNALTFTIGHAGTGARYKTAVNVAKGPMGVWLSGQGVIIMEDEPIPLSIPTNAGNGSTRYDLVVATHNYVKVGGGQDATYSIIPGPLNAIAFGSLTDPLKQVILGTLEIPAGATTLDGVAFYKARCPDSGDQQDARLNEPNNFTAFNQLRRSSVNLLPFITDVLNPPPSRKISFTTAGQAAYLWSLPIDGNVFELIPGLFQFLYVPGNTIDGFRFDRNLPIQEGAEFKIFSTKAFMFRDAYGDAIPSALYNAGYRAIKIPPGFLNADLNGVPGVQAQGDETWLYCFQYYHGKWQMIDIQNRASGGSTVVTANPTGGADIANYSMLDSFNNPVVDFIKPKHFIYNHTNPAVTYARFDVHLDGGVPGTVVEITAFALPANFPIQIVATSAANPSYGVVILREGPYATEVGSNINDNNYLVTLKFLGLTKDPAPGSLYKYMISYRFTKINIV